MSDDPKRLASLERHLAEIQSDPRYDGTLLGAGGPLDRQSSELRRVRHLWAERFPQIPFGIQALKDWLAGLGITPLLADRMTLGEVEVRLLQIPVSDQRRGGEGEEPHGPRDGPTEDGGFCWQGRRFELTRTQYRLLADLWTRVDGRPGVANTREVVLAVWGDEEKEATSLSSTLSRLNATLLRNQVPVAIQKRGDFLEVSFH